MTPKSITLHHKKGQTSVNCTTLLQPGCKISESDDVMMQLPKLLLTPPLEIYGILWIRDFFYLLKFLAGGESPDSMDLLPFRILLFI